VRAELTGADGIMVSWDPVDGGTLPVTYTVTRSTDGQTAGSTQPKAVWAGLDPGTYRFTVAATTAAGTSPGSTPSNAVTVAAPVPDPPAGLTARRTNMSGSLFIQSDWEAPTASPVPVIGYELSATGAIKSGTYRTADPTYLDGDNYCSPKVTVSVRSLASDGTTSAPATIVVDSPVDCTPFTEITSAAAQPDGSVTVVVDCQSGARGPDERSEIDVLLNGQKRNTDVQTCKHTPETSDKHTFAITGLQPATTYSVTARTTSHTGTKTSAAVQVTTNP
jgi:hypothetical protein